MIDDPLPGDLGPGRKSSHSVTDHSGRAAADDLRDLPIGSHLARRNPADGFINLLVPGNVSAFHSSNLFGLAKKSNHFCLEENDETSAGARGQRRASRNHEALVFPSAGAGPKAFRPPFRNPF